MSKSPYAHLVKSATKAKEVDPDESERMEHEPPADDKEDNKKSGKEAKGKKASDEGETEEEEDEKDSDEGEEEEEKEDKKEKKNKDRDDKEDKKGKKASASDVHAATLAERERCAKIFQSDAAAGRVAVAAQFAFHTDMSADAAIAIMENIPQASSSGRARLDERMATAAKADIGTDVLPRESIEAAAPLDEKKFAALSPEKKALMIVNATRKMRNEEPLKQLEAA